MPRLSYKEIIKRLNKSGFILWRQAKGSHEIWRNIELEKKVTVPRKTKDYNLGTLSSIAKQAGFKNLHEFEVFGKQ